MLMATATLATTGLAGVLALSRNHSTDSDTANTAAGGTTSPASTTRQSKTRQSKQQKPTATGQGFTPASRPTATTGPSHTKSSGS